MIAHSSEEYRAMVARALIGADEEKLVFNGTIDHARVVIEEALRVASSHIRILSNSLSPACYDSPTVIQAVEGFLSKPDTRIDVLVEEPDGRLARSAFLQAIIGAGVRTRVNQVPAEIVGLYSFNFMTVDDTGFRFEEDRAKPIAVVGGGRPSAINRHLVGVFDDLFKRSNTLSLTLEPA